MALVEIKGLKKHYQVGGGWKKKQFIHALDGVTFSIEKKQTLGIVGESGCGKSTLAKVLLGLETPTAGTIKIDGKDLSSIELTKRQHLIQMIFQDPYSSINPRKKAWNIIAEPLLINSKLSKKECRIKAQEMMERVGLRASLADRYPHMFSGGQRQRIGIARSLILHPKILVCDEPVSALDVSIQAQVINLLLELQREFDLTYIFISHDLSVIKHLADQVMVMYLGKIVEMASRQDLFATPKHPYTQALLSATPKLIGNLEQDIIKLKGELPSPLNPPSGCSFHQRCLYANSKCEEIVPDLDQKEHQLVACHHTNNLIINPE